MKGGKKNQMLICIKVVLSVKKLLFLGSEVYVFYFTKLASIRNCEDSKSLSA